MLVFVPSVNGISHATTEFTRDEDLIGGLEVLTGIATRLVTDPPAHDRSN